MEQKRAIIGVGNLLYTDEGVGVHAVRALMKKKVSPEILIFDGGTEGFGLMDLIVNLERLVIIDCLRSGEKPGTVYKFDFDELKFNKSKNYQTSIHQCQISDVLSLSTMIGKPPRTTIIGIEPASLEISMELSSVIAELIPAICEISLKEVMID